MGVCEQNCIASRVWKLTFHFVTQFYRLTGYSGLQYNRCWWVWSVLDRQRCVYWCILYEQNFCKALWVSIFSDQKILGWQPKRNFLTLTWNACLLHSLSVWCGNLKCSRCMDFVWIMLFLVIIKICLNFWPWEKVSYRGLQSHNCSAFSIEQVLAQRTETSFSGVKHVLPHDLQTVSPEFSLSFPSTSLKGYKKDNLCFTGEIETSSFNSLELEKCNWDQVES